MVPVVAQIEIRNPEVDLIIRPEASLSLHSKLPDTHQTSMRVLMISIPEAFVMVSERICD